jgi:hypothetical protein
MLTFGQEKDSQGIIDLSNTKVHSFQGIEVSVLPYKDDRYISSFYYSLNPSGYLGFFNEQSIAPTWSLRWTAGVQEVFVRKNPYVFDYSNYQPGTDKRIDYLFKMGVETRWYVTYKKRNSDEKAALKSGCFLSLPISMDFMYNNDYNEMGYLYPDHAPKYIKSLHVMPTLGYRYAFPRHFYMEGAAGLDYGYGQYKYDSRDFITRHDYSLRLSVGYAF